MKSSYESEVALRELLGQSENSRLEFKSGRMFEKSENEIKDELSTQVSAFANAEGGTLILGMRETKGKERVAESLDGVPANVTAQWLQQILTSNISPLLPGIRVSSVK